MPRDYGTDGYNGWRNRATWGVSLILNNEEGYYRMVLDWIDEYVESGMTREDAKDALADAIEDLVEEEYELLDPTDWPPLMQQLMDDPCMMDIDYWEIAEGFIDGYEYGKDNVWAQASQCRKKPAKSQCVKRTQSKKSSAKKPASKAKQSNNRKPRTTSGKKPAPRRR